MSYARGMAAMRLERSSAHIPALRRFDGPAGILPVLTLTYASPPR